MIISNSGVNNVIVEMALQAKQQGHKLLALTSLSHTHAVPAGHSSGKKLVDLADVVLDNAAPRGDALLELPGGGAVCALSTLTGVMLVQMAVAEASAVLLAAGERPPVYVSANVPGASRGTWSWSDATRGGSGVRRVEAAGAFAHLASPPTFGSAEVSSIPGCSVRPHDVHGDSGFAGFEDCVRGAAAPARLRTVPHGNEAVSALQQHAVGVCVRRPVRRLVVQNHNLSSCFDEPDVLPVFLRREDEGQAAAEFRHNL